MSWEGGTDSPTGSELIPSSWPENQQRLNVRTLRGPRVKLGRCCRGNEIITNVIATTEPDPAGVA